jgi:hypothetical protein
VPQGLDDFIQEVYAINNLAPNSQEEGSESADPSLGDWSTTCTSESGQALEDDLEGESEEENTTLNQTLETKPSLLARLIWGQARRSLKHICVPAPFVGEQVAHQYARTFPNCNVLCNGNTIIIEIKEQKYGKELLVICWAYL